MSIHTSTKRGRVRTRSQDPETLVRFAHAAQGVMLLIFRWRSRCSGTNNYMPRSLRMEFLSPTYRVVNSQNISFNERLTA
jgi:hypothetical protein